jgi:pyruvate dehydrogenase E2 component (dihydrolipoamide acetyltransferase)
MATLLRMPEVAANATEAVLQDWALGERSAFDEGDVIATVETEKAVVDVEAEASGVLLKTLVGAGAEVEVGAPIAVLGRPGEQVDDLEGLLADLGVVAGAPVVAPERRMVPDDPEGGTANTTAPEVPAASAAPEGAAAPASQVIAAMSDGSSAGRRVFASPLARRLAAEAGLVLEEIEGSGPRGRILRRDVDRAAAEGSRAPRDPSATPAYTDLPHSRMRRAIAARLSRSTQETPHFYVRATVRVDRLLKLRRRLESASGEKVSVNDLVVKAVARALVLVPEANVIWTADALRRFSGVDVSVAVATDTGLVTPVLREVDRMPLSVLAATVRDSVERARAGQLRQGELEGGSISVTNLGMYGVEEFAAIINPPQSAIVAVGAAREAVVVRRGKPATATVMTLTMSVDHRAIDGALAARLLKALTSVLEEPVQLLL